MVTSERTLSSAPGRRSGVAVKKQIADTLGTEIRDLVFTASGRLPSENELSTHFGVNRQTLHQAVATLQADGLVRIEPGRGTFVQHELEMLDEANDQPIALATEYYTASRFNGRLEMLGKGTSTISLLRHFGVEGYERAESRVTTQMPSDETARLLRQPVTRPVLCVECLDVDMSGQVRSGQAIKYGETVFCGDRIQLVVNAGGDL